MRIMTSHLAKRVGSIKLSDGQYTQTGKETIEEIYNLHSLPGKRVCRQAWRQVKVMFIPKPRMANYTPSKA